MWKTENKPISLILLLWPYILYALIVVIFWPAYYGHFVPNDSISYLSIAEKYASGHFGNAINAYWSPMISWILAILLKLGLAPINAFHLIKIGSGLLVIYYAQKIVRLYTWPLWAIISSITIISGWAAYFTLHYLSPDALMTAGLTIYLYMVVTGKWLQKPIPTGILGAALYFIKAYGFFFFATHLFLYTAWLIIIYRKRSLTFLKKMAQISIVFLLLSLVWMLAIYQRYHQFTVSTAGAYNHGLMRFGNGSVQPSLHAGLLPLPDSAAYNSWEEITLVHNYEKWAPWRGEENMKLQLNVIKNNGWDELKIIYGANRLAWPTLVVFFVLVLYFVRNKILKKEKFITQHIDLHAYIFSLLYCFGYALAGVDERYLWITNIILLILTLNLAVRCSYKIHLPSVIWWITAVVIMFFCGKEIIGKLQFFSFELRTQLADAQLLRQYIKPKTVIATHETNSINAIDYLGQWHNHGGLEGYTSTAQMIAGLKQYHIQMVLIPDSLANSYLWLNAESDTIIAVKNWNLYKLRKSYSGF